MFLNVHHMKVRLIFSSDLKGIIEELYKKNPDWKCVLDFPEKFPVDSIKTLDILSFKK